ncbi:MAG: sigma-70 family RNA polymerase sigma factor [Gemmatimonadota bacterium]|nr:sigma-70 family RNA polymerase sigma factor [Gemmatimonadota bacterium]
MRISHMQDAELAALAQAGDREAFGELVARYAAQARRLATAILGDPDDGDDAAQDGFLAALKHLGRFDPERPFGPWLMRIVANAAGDRRRRRRVRKTEQISGRQAAATPGPDVETDRQRFRIALQAALAELPERQRMAVVLFDAEGYTHREVGEILNVPEGTARSDVFHARRALREKLEAWNDWKEEG